MNLRSKVLALFGATVVLPSVVTLEVLVHQATQDLRAEIGGSSDAALLLAARALDACIASGEGPGDLEEICARQALDEHLRASPYIFAAELTWLQGDRHPIEVDISPRANVAAPRGGTVTRSIDLSVGDDPLRLLAHADATLLHGLRQRLVKTFVLVVAVALISSLALLYWGSEFLVMRPLERLRKQVEQVAEGSLERRLGKLRERSDEIGVLARSLQNMIEALSEARAEKDELLAKERASIRLLDERVEEATAKLRRTTFELEQALDALLESRELLGRQERLAALGQLAGTIAHELGTPLSTLSGHLELLSMGDLNQEDREAIGAARHEVERMTDVIRRFLSNTRGMHVTHEAVDIKELLDHSIDLVLRPDDREHLEVRRRIGESAEHLMIDRGLVTQILINLVANARDALDGHGVLEIEAHTRGDQLILMVGDSGPGIPHGQRAKIFEPFFTTKDPERGTGLGLSICLEIAKTLKGDLSVGESPLGGALFVLTIPALSPNRQGSRT